MSVQNRTRSPSPFFEAMNTRRAEEEQVMAALQVRFSDYNQECKEKHGGTPLLIFLSERYNREGNLGDFREILQCFHYMSSHDLWDSACSEDSTPVAGTSGAFRRTALECFVAMRCQKTGYQMAYDLLGRKIETGDPLWDRCLRIKSLVYAVGIFAVRDHYQGSLLVSQLLKQMNREEILASTDQVLDPFQEMTPLEIARQHNLQDIINTLERACQSESH